MDGPINFLTGVFEDFKQTSNGMRYTLEIR